MCFSLSLSLIADGSHPFLNHSTHHEPDLLARTAWMISFVSIGLGLLFPSGATTFADPTQWWIICYTTLHSTSTHSRSSTSSPRNERRNKLSYDGTRHSEALALGTKTGMSTRMIHSAIKSALGNSWSVFLTSLA